MLNIRQSRNGAAEQLGQEYKAWEAGFKDLFEQGATLSPNTQKQLFEFMDRFDTLLEEAPTLQPSEFARRSDELFEGVSQSPDGFDEQQAFILELKRRLNGIDVGVPKAAELLSSKIRTYENAAREATEFFTGLKGETDLPRSLKDSIRTLLQFMINQCKSHSE